MSIAFTGQGLTKLMAANSTATAALAAGIVAAASPSPSSFAIRKGRAMSAIILPYGVGSDNQDFAFKLFGTIPIWAPGGGRGRSVPDAWYRMLLGYGTYTLGSGVSATAARAAGVIGSTDLLADTITLTVCTTGTSPKGIGQSWEDAYQLGTPTVFSPADDSNMAALLLPFPAMCSHLEFECVPGTGTSANALVEMQGE